jgi:S1-C subfamily serine protease
MGKQMNPTKSLLSYITAILVLGTVVATAQTPQQIAKNALDATVLLVMEDADGQPLGLGSGFFVRKGLVATNLHVIEDAAKGYAKSVGQETRYDIEGMTATDDDNDLAILKVTVLDVPVLPLGDSDAVQVGEAVYVVGNPRGLDGTFSQGVISSYTIGT